MAEKSATCNAMENTENKGAAGFLAALHPVESENYLGDPDVVCFLLRNYAHSCLGRVSEMTDQRTAAAQMDIDDGQKLADVFLGKNPHFASIPGYNIPGVIDRWLVDEFHIGGTTPEDRVRGVILSFLSAMYDVWKLTENQSDENIKLQVDAVVQEFSSLLLGSPEWNAPIE